MFTDISKDISTISKDGFQQFYILPVKKIAKLKRKTALQVSKSSYKFHISLACDNYLLHRENLKKIIFKHLKLFTIEEFKITSQEDILYSISQLKELFEKTQKYERCLKKELELDNSWEEIYLYQIKQHFNMNSNPTLEEITYIMFILEDEYKASQRFIEGDQFTLYIPKQYDPVALLKMCQEIDCYLTKNNAVAGKITDVELPLGEYLNFRQEFLIDDYKKINLNLINANNNRIPAVAPYKLNDKKQKQRYAVVIEETESPLYQFLSTYFLIDNKLEKQRITIDEDVSRQNSFISEKEGLIKNSFFSHPTVNNAKIKSLSLRENKTQSNCCILL